MKIGVVGLGVVGSAIQQVFSQRGHTVPGYDIKNSDTCIDDVIDTECVFVCVPTNLNNHGQCDVSQVQQVIDQLAQRNYTGTVVIKSTVIPGTTQQLIEHYSKLKICFVPEFLRERHAVDDFVNDQQVLIVGSEQADVVATMSRVHAKFSAEIMQIHPTEAELAKYFSNCINALHIIFANAVFEMSQHLGANYNNVLAASVTRPNVASRAYLECSADQRGYGGRCLPKDLQAFAEFVKNHQPNIRLFDAVIQDNKYYHGSI